MKRHLISTFSFLLVFTFSGKVKAQVCGIRTGAHFLDYEINGPLYQNPSQALTINTIWYIVRDGEGNGVNELSMIEEVIERVKIEYAAMGIRLVSTCDYSDNEIIEINNDELYGSLVYPESDLCLFQDLCTHDALNVFILDYTFPENNTGPSGVALVPGNLCFAKIASEEDYPVVCHEIGHCFGLWHTNQGRPYWIQLPGVNNFWSCDDQEGVVGTAYEFESCGTFVGQVYFPFELVDGTNSNSAGDFVTDTPADLGMTTLNCSGMWDNCDPQENCENNLEDDRWKDPNCDEYHPDWTNFMRDQSDNGCSDHFTIGQASRMRGVINHFLQYLMLPYNEPDPNEPCQQCFTGEDDPCFSCTEIPLTNYDISVSGTFNLTDIHGVISIKSGVALTIQNTVRFSPPSKIVVEDNARLIIDGGVLTSMCEEGTKWIGIQVAGQFDLGSFSPAGSSSLKRGFVELKNGAVLEKAIVGIDGRDLFVAGGDITPGMQFYHGGGKITIASGSIIQDCRIGVRLHRYGWGSVIGAGATGPGYPIGYEDEPSAFTNSFFKNCDLAAIYSDQNVGLSLVNNEFSQNHTDYEGYLSSITATGNDFLSPLFIIASEHPVIPGSIFSNNTFANSILGIDGQGNTKRHIFKQNAVDASSLWLTGELLYGVSENAFSNSGYIGLFTESTGEDIYNWTLDNSFYGQKYAISVFGENDTEYLANCFSSTTYADLEINSGSSIHETQGNEDQSAGNCFNYYGRIKTGNGISPFEYWTKDGYHASCQPVLNCKYPGACNVFSLERSDVELEVDCETNIIGEPPSGLNCECGSGLTGCTDAIASVRSSISGLGSSAGNGLLKAQYRRCIDKLIRTFVDTAMASGEVEDVIDFLSAQPEFRYRVMAYGIMTHNLEYGRASVYIDTLATSKTEEQAFVNVQKIWLDYIMDIDSFTLSPTDSMKIRVAGEAFNPLAGYARTVFYKLTGERITRDFIHTDSTVTPRSSSEILPANSTVVSVDMHVWPNPLTGHGADIQLLNPDYGMEYVLVIYDAIGTIRSTTSVSNKISHVPVSDTPGIYFICLFQNGELIQTKKVVRI